MRVLFINKFTPPDPAPTAVLIDAVASMVRDAGGEACFAGSHAGYRARRVSGWRRWAREAWGNLQLLWRGLTAPRPDVVICLTDPPGCLVIAAVVASLRRVKLVHWAMDVYPEIAVALGELRAGSLIHRVIRAAMRWAYGRCIQIGCLDEDMIDTLGLRGDPRVFISTPWPTPGLSLAESIPAPTAARVRWLYSGNLGRAHDYATLLQAQRRLEDAQAPFDLVFQGGGPSREAAQRLAAELRLEHCVWLDYAPEEKLLQSMLECHLLIATQKNETRGMLWPSKLAPMLALPRPILWIGPSEGAVAALIRRSDAQHGVFSPGDDASVAQWLIDSRQQFLEAPACPAPPLNARISRIREDALADWRTRLEGLAAHTARVTP